MSALPRHLLSTENLTLDQIESLCARAEFFLTGPPPAELKKSLLGKSIVNLFFADSTRTRISFEMAAKRLGADVVNVAVEHSSLNKGETFLDMMLNLQALGASAIVIRHPESFVLNELSRHMAIPIINAGDGNNEHPTQGLLDIFTMRRHKGELRNLQVAICGDLAHSRVARSNIHLLIKYGASVRAIAPQSLMPKDYFNGRVKTFTDMAEGIKGADVVMALRIQKERMQNEEIPNEREYFFYYGLDHQKLKHAKPDAIVMDPGPINRGVQLDSALADDPKHSVILDQVRNGVAMRMAVLEWLLKSGE